MVPIVYKPKCREELKSDKPLLVTKLNICTGLYKGGKGLCEGDSGGPLSIRLNNSWTQVGIVSSRHCREPGSFTVHY